MIMLVCFFGPGWRIGEAHNPGPGIGDSQASLDWDDELPAAAPWDDEPATADMAQSAVGQEVPSFVSAKKFAGRRPGAVFKLGDAGLGYYKDAPPIVELFPALHPLHGVPPVVLRLEELLELSSTDAPAVVEVPSRGQRRRRCRRARKTGTRRARAGPLSCQPTLGKSPAVSECDEESSEASEELHWPDDGSLSASDRSHITAGLWAIDTINANAWPGTLEFLLASAADFVAAQECRIRSEQCAEKEASARSSKWCVSLEPCIITEAGSTSSGVAIGARSHIGVAAPATATGCYSTVLHGRFCLRRIGAVCRGGFHLGSVYLHDTVGVMAANNLDLLQEVAAELALVCGGWVVGGDWNCTPAELAATGWLDLVGGAVCAPQAATCNGNVYDFFVVKRQFQHAVHSVHTIGDALCKPHSPARLLLRGSPRCVMVRGLKRPRGFGAVLPHGPPVAPSAICADEGTAIDVPDVDVDIDAEYCQFISCVETALSAIAGHDIKETAAHAGRAHGLSFGWRNACGFLATQPSRSTPAARAWRRVANWLNDIRRRGVDSKEAVSLRRRLLCYDHGGSEDGLNAQLEAWLGLLTDELLQSSSWVRSMCCVADEAVQRAEAEAARAARLAWSSWLADGPAKGLRRQHRMSRTAIGWVPAHVAVPVPVSLSEADSLDGVDEALLTESLEYGAEASSLPLNPQQAADQAADVWAAEWGVGLELPDVAWPADLGPLPPPLLLPALQRALAEFPASTGLGWDNLHPRALLRLSDGLLLALLRLLTACERIGRWPKAVAMVVIALLPKPDGGRRPIGLFPWLPRVWMKVRRDVACEWERLHERPYLYAGVGKGANVAAWKQAARAELARALPGVEYGQVLLDLVKAFERVPHHVLVREAARLQFPLWVLRLSLAAYRLGRVLRVDGAISSVVVAVRGITAGSGLATTEMRILLLHIVDRACALYPAVTPTLFVDDLSAEVAGTKRYILRNLIPFVICVCDGMTDALLEVSQKKSVCTASCDDIGVALAAGLRRYAVAYARRVKSLGAGLGAGVRRNAQVATKRLKAFRQRLPRFRRLRAAGVSTARLLRTGGIAAMTYGQAIIGVPSSILLQQRRSAAAAAAPSNGICGQSLDLALIVADESIGGKADPAYAAHVGPIFEWAQAVWEQWIPLPALMRLVASSKLRLDRAVRPWSVVRGPAAAVVATATRLGWTVHDARRFTTDTGRELDLAIDPPVVVARECEAAVRRWRWRSVEQDFPSLDSGGAGRGAFFGPVMALLRPKSESPEWTSDLRGALRSAVLGRQWPQSRCFAAGYADHNRCCLCVEAALAHHGVSCIDELPHEVIDGLPIGNLVHRVWSCPAHREARSQYAPDDVRFRQPSSGNTAAYTRALVPSLDHEVPPPASEATFSWIVRPEYGTICACFYTDGSRLDGPSALLARNGWAFVAIDEHGEIVASAHGVPPPWIDDIPGTEAWALLQAAQVAEPGSTYRIDCKPCVDAIKRGRVWATSAARPLARVFELVFAAVDDTPLDAFVWMPAHCSMDEVGVVRLGNGSLLTETDRRGNALADEYAKAAVEAHRVPSAVRQRLRDAAKEVQAIAKWLGRVTHLAGHQAGPQRRDSEASRRATGRRRAADRQQRRDGAPAANPRGALLAVLEPLRARIAARAATHRGAPEPGVV